MSDNHRWEFYLDARGLWCWRRFDGTASIVSDSKRCFPTRDECIADAEKHGFAARSTRRVKAVKAASMRSARQDVARHGGPDHR